ncbi:MAG: L,D-transpeptidase family protein [Candidatus Hydrogenedentes bacterium]|nr:L,D-transpeptidase family protein [Candidatus Hydrogenedentota bacterium]
MTTARDVLFSGEGSLLREGTVVDISGGGFQVRTPRPEPVGTKVDAEIHPRPGDGKSEMIFLEGRVVRVAELGPGEYAMGVRAALPTAGHPARPAPPQPLHPRDASPPFPHRPVEPVDAAPSTPPRAGRRSRNGRRAAFGILVFLCMLALLLLLGRDAPGRPRGGVTAYPAEGRDSAATDPAPEELLLPEDTARLAQRARDDKLGHMAAGMASPPAIDGPQPGFASVVPQDGDGLGPGWQPGDGTGRGGPAYASLALPAGGEPAGMGGPGPGFYPGNGAPAGPAGRGTRAGRTPASKRTPAEAYRHDVYVSVDKSEFALTVYVHGRMVRRFPVGLGVDDSTPTGRYYVANKLSDPDWFNGGDVVPAGDPRNPLGKRWMGLGNTAGPTSYGIHPTTDPASVGCESSQGCIRLRPEDAETLFRLCPIGTPVQICL